MFKNFRLNFFYLLKIPRSIQKILPSHLLFFFFFQIQSLKIPYPYPMVTYINNSIQKKNHPYQMKKNLEKNITKKKKKTLIHTELKKKKKK